MSTWNIIINIIAGILFVPLPIWAILALWYAGELDNRTYMARTRPSEPVPTRRRTFVNMLAGK